MTFCLAPNVATDSLFQDAAAACLFLASKSEDTNVKSKSILCAAYNMKNPTNALTPDDPGFDGPAKNITILERMVLEAVGFDYRVRHPLEFVIKLAHSFKLSKMIAEAATYICYDSFRTYLPLKKTNFEIAVACLELACYLEEDSVDIIKGIDYEKFEIVGRQGVMGKSAICFFAICGISALD
jgi:CTD kinase subunit beta